MIRTDVWVVKGRFRNRGSFGWEIWNKVDAQFVKGVETVPDWASKNGRYVNVSLEPGGG